jgi:hypothetical protein
MLGYFRRSSMKLREMVSLLLATCSGFLGGLAAPWLQRYIITAQLPAEFARPSQVTADFVRTTRLELMDKEGQLLAILGRTNSLEEETTLTFLNRDGKAIVSVGMQRERSPFFQLNAQDGTPRASLALSYLDQPALALTDGRHRPRVVLGAFEGDSNPTVESTSWALTFTGPGRFTPVADIGMRPDLHNDWYVGGLIVSKPGKSFIAP